jgi:carbonic anhydrase
MNRLVEGYRRFRTHRWPERRQAFEALARNGQSPETLVLGCIDSQVDPAMIFDAAPGELLVLRNVANLAPPYQPDAAYHGASAALEFGIKALRVKRIVVLGHGLCGGVRALLDGAPANAGEFVAPWMSIAAPARDRAMASPAGAARQRRCEFEVIKVSLANLATFPWIAERVAAGSLELYGAWFDIQSGEMLVLGPDGSFALPR